MAENSIDSGAQDKEPSSTASSQHTASAVTGSGSGYRPGPASTDFTNPQELRKYFDEYLRGFDYSSTSSTKYKELEQKLAEYASWRSVAMKYIGDTKNIRNRISESRNRPDKPLHAIIFVPSKVAENAVEAAKELVAAGEFLAIGVAITDSNAVSVRDLIYENTKVEPKALKSAFPDMELHEIEVATAREIGPHGEVVGKGSFSLSDCAKETGTDPADIQTWLTRLERKKHLVFQGPPGTGKTFVAARLARLLVARSGGYVGLVQFHPAYSYEDFVQGIRPELVSGQVTYSLKRGRFLEFCEVARCRPNESFVLIIDEMNRGNLASIFGELLFLLEYRDRPILLSQGGEPFAVPSNLYVIGTMNTADRSIALVDHAIRRRFSFVFLGPNYDALTEHLSSIGLPAENLVKVLQKVNLAIGDKNYHVGTSFFLGSALRSREDLKHIWQGEIEPYLEEYFFDNPSKVDEFRWETLAARDLAEWAHSDGL